MSADTPFYKALRHVPGTGYFVALSVVKTGGDACTSSYCVDYPALGEEVTCSNTWLAVRENAAGDQLVDEFETYNEALELIFDFMRANRKQPELVEHIAVWSDHVDGITEEKLAQHEQHKAKALTEISPIGAAA